MPGCFFFKKITGAPPKGIGINLRASRHFWGICSWERRDGKWRIRTEYWIVDIDARTLEQYRPAAEGRYEQFDQFEKEDTVQSDKLPCVSFVLDDIFKEIPNFEAGTAGGDS
nr:Uma2 family endonuclease [Cohnella zeiphila]